MVEKKNQPHPQWNQVEGSRDFRELFRYRRAGELRIYSLRVIPGGAELWRITETAGELPTTVKEDDFTAAADAMQTLEELKQRLRAGGWQEISTD
jgi:hypothetical protein